MVFRLAHESCAKKVGARMQSDLEEQGYELSRALPALAPSLRELDLPDVLGGMVLPAETLASLQVRFEICGAVGCCPQCLTLRLPSCLSASVPMCCFSDDVRRPRPRETTYTDTHPDRLCRP